MIKSRDLIQIISYKLGRFRGEPISDADLQEIKDLAISGKKINGKDSDIDWNELTQLTNLELLSVSQFIIDDAKLKVLKSMPQIKSIAFSRCDLSGKGEMNFEGVSSLTYKHCRIQDYSNIGLADFTTFIGERKLDLRSIVQKNRVKKLKLYDCTIDSFQSLSDYNALEQLLLEGTTVNDINSRNDIRKGIDVTENKNPYPIR